MFSWYYKKKIETIDVFQFESLLNNYVKFQLFIFFSSAELPEAALSFFKNRVEINEFAGVSSFKEKVVELDSPIILICKRGQKSPAMAFKLTKEGYKNVYVFEGGMENLLLHIKSNS